MAYPTTTVFNPKPSAPWVGAQAILDTSTTQNHPLGTVVKARDYGTAQAGEAEYIYLKGVASTVAGDLVVFDAKAATTVRVADDTSGGAGQAAVAMSANVASQYGWYAIKGVVPVASGTVAAAAPCYLTSTAGTIDDAVVAGDLIVGMTTSSADSAGFAYCQLSNPYISQTTS